MPKIVVTGAGGYVGGRLIPILTEAGWDVHGIGREPTPRLSIEESLCDLGSPGSYDVVVAACEGADAVIHLAGENEVVAANRPAAALAGTVTATERVAEACAATGVRRLIYTSTMHVYGARVAPGATLLEEMRVEPRSIYAISRLASEHIAASRAAGAYELLVLRLTNTVGAPDHVSVDRWSLIVNDLCRQAVTTGALELRSDGLQWRDFVPLASICDAIAFACQTSGSTLTPGTYNLGSGTPRTVRSVAELIQDAFERETGERPPLHAPAPSGPAPDPYYVSVDRASEQGVVLGDPLEDAILDTVRFCLQHREELMG